MCGSLCDCVCARAAALSGRALVRTCVRERVRVCTRACVCSLVRFRMRVTDLDECVCARACPSLVTRSIYEYAMETRPTCVFVRVTLRKDPVRTPLHGRRGLVPSGEDCRQTPCKGLPKVQMPRCVRGCIRSTVASEAVRLTVPRTHPLPCQGTQPVLFKRLLPYQLGARTSQKGDRSPSTHHAMRPPPPWHLSFARQSSR